MVLIPAVLGSTTADNEYHRKPCPSCGAYRIRILHELEVRPIGTFSLAGAQMKVSAIIVPVLKCDNCGLTLRGVIKDGYAIFDPGVSQKNDFPSESPD